ncbi:hypothetical protein Tco_0157866 [Tanacetum coccineum]
MAPKRTTRSTPVTPTPNATTTTTVTEAQLQALMTSTDCYHFNGLKQKQQGRNGYNSNGSGPRQPKLLAMLLILNLANANL